MIIQEEDKMSKNISKKLKNIAAVIMIVGTLLSFIFGAGVMSSSRSFDGNAISGIIYIGLGIFISYLSAWVIFGFGELIAQAQKTNRLLESLLDQIGDEE